MPPASEALVPRPQLVSSLLTSLERSRLTALVAPAGYGKTSLLTLALEPDSHNAWYTAQLWHAGEFAEPLVRAVRGRRPGFGRLTLALAAQHPRRSGAASAASAQRLGATFAEELGHVAEPIRLIFDDVHLLEGDAGFGEFVTGLMRTLPAGVSIVLCGRTLPSLPLAEWIAQGRAELLGAEHLRFDDEDVAQLASRRGRELSSRQVSELREAFEGWAAGIALSLSGSLTLPSREGSRSATTALLIDANLAALDDDMVAFLERTAVFETLHAPVLERDSALADVRRYLREYERRGVMLSVVKPSEIFRVHPLLREALVERVRARDGTPAIERNHRWAGELLEAAGGADLAALFHFERSRDDPRLARFIQEHAYALFIAGLGERAGRIVHELRERGLEAPALYGLVEGMLLRQRGEPGAGERLGAALTSARGAGDSETEMTVRSVLTEERLTRREHLPEGDLEELMRLARSRGGTNELVAYTLAGWSQVLAGDFLGARQSAHAAFARAGGDLVSRARIAILDAYAATALGLFEEADALMAEMLHALEPSDHVVLMANTLVWYARLALLWGDIGAAKDYAAKGRELGRRLELPAELAGVELALAEVFSHEGALTECENAAAAARSYGDAAWYSADRERADALAELYRARAQFCNAGAATALSTARSALSGAGVPAAQRVVILAEAAAYAKIASDGDWEKLAAAAEVALAEAGAGDALDALAIAGAAGILHRLRAGSAFAAAQGSPIPAAVTATYGALLARRGDLALNGAAEARSGSRFAALLFEALTPARARSEVHANGEPVGSKLTRREVEILELLAEGLTNKEIAQRFSVSPRTVDTHVERVLSKLNATTRTRAVAAAIRAGIVPSPSSLDLR